MLSAAMTATLLTGCGDTKKTTSESTTTETEAEATEEAASPEAAEEAAPEAEPPQADRAAAAATAPQTVRNERRVIFFIVFLLRIQPGTGPVSRVVVSLGTALL